MKRNVHDNSVVLRSLPLFRALALFTLFALFMIAPITSLAEEGREYLAVDGGYKTGDFGTPIRTNLYYITPELGYVSPTYDVSVSLPYLFLESSGSGQTGIMNSGIGNVIVRGGRVLVPDGDGGFSLDGSLAIKLPTADKGKGFGTGEADYGAFVGAHQRFDEIKFSLLTGYIKVGEPPSVTYNDIYLYGIGVSKIFGGTDVYISFEGRRAMVPGAKNPEEINAGFFHILDADYTIKGSAFVGLNKGGPDNGLDFGLVRWF